MLPTDISTAVAAIAALFAANAAQSAGDDLGHGASGLIKRITRTVWQRFHSDPEREEQLHTIAGAPADELDTQAVADLLGEVAAEDAEFAAELIALTAEAEQAGLLRNFRAPDGGVHVRDVTQKGRNNTVIIGSQVNWRTTQLP